MGNPGQDLKVVLRRLRRTPLTSLVIVVTLGLVLGANTLTFSFVNEILLNPLPAIPDKTGLVNIHRFQNDKDGVQGFSYPAYRGLADADVFDKGLVGYNGRGLSLERNGTPELVFGMLVSENYFDVLGVRPRVGRGFGASDNRTGAPGVAILSDAIWRSRFGADPKVLGTPIRLNGRSFTVIGIGPPRFTGHFVGFAADLWIPLSWSPAVSGQSDLLESSSTDWLEAFARLKPGGAEAAAATLSRINASLPRAEASSLLPERILVEPLTGIDRDLQAPIAAFLALLQGATIMVALIALVNVSSLLLARSLERGHETAVRLALGASAGSLLAPFSIEAMVLCGMGTALGLFVSVLGARMAPGLLPPFAIPVRFDLSLDGRTFAFSALVGLAGTLVAALGPSLATTRSHPAFALREGGPQRTRRSRWRSFLVVAQVGFATAVLVVGSVFARYLAHSATASPGFEIDRVQITRLDASVLGLDAASSRLLQRRAVEAIASLPGVERVSFARAPLFGVGTSSLDVRNGSTAAAPWFKADWNAVSPGFFESLGLHETRGRTFSEFDGAEAPRVVVINESLATRLFPNEDPVGRSLAIGPKDEAATVIGVVPDLSSRRLGEAPRPQVFRPFDQAPTPRISIFTRSSNPAGLASLIRPAVARVAPDLPLLESLPLRDFASFSQAGARLGGGAGLALGGLGLVLAAVGLFGLVAQTVASRVREIAIRMAVGATSAQILRLVLGEGARLGMFGLALGLLGAIGAAPLISNLAPAMSVADPLAFAAAALLVLAVTGLAILGPAWRASRISPSVALRAQ
ncbi:MAG: ADOP family duplicated permease [Vicinamibacteria bacterium]